MKPVMISLFIVATLLIFAGSINIYSYDAWIDAKNKPCDVVCKNAGLQPVVSGVYKNGNPFFVCAANAGGEGFRAGYNLKPGASNICVVGWGEQELSVGAYKCLCK